MFSVDNVPAREALEAASQMDPATAEQLRPRPALTAP